MFRLQLHTWIAGVLACAGLLVLGTGRGSVGDLQRVDTSLVHDFTNVRNGDVIFVTGRSWRSLVVHKLGWGEEGYSHVGIVRIDDGARVIHAIPSLPDGEGEGRVYEEALEDVLSTRRISKAVLYRPTGMTGELGLAVASRAQELALRAVPFDHEFSFSSRDRLYCTELIISVFRDSGVDLMKWDTENDDVLMPDELSRSELLVRVAEFASD